MQRKTLLQPPKLHLNPIKRYLISKRKCSAAFCANRVASLRSHNASRLYVFVGVYGEPENKKCHKLVVECDKLETLPQYATKSPHLSMQIPIAWRFTSGYFVVLVVCKSLAELLIVARFTGGGFLFVHAPAWARKCRRVQNDRSIIGGAAALSMPIVQCFRVLTSGSIMLASISASISHTAVQWHVSVGSRNQSIVRSDPVSRVNLVRAYAAQTIYARLIKVKYVCSRFRLLIATACVCVCA